MLTSLTAMSMDAVLPGLRAIGLELGAAPPLSTQSIISLFILGMAFGEIAIGPISDAIGRKPALFLGLGLYLAGTLLALFAGSIEVLVLGRFLQGVGVAGPKIATRAMIRDQFEGDAMARVMSMIFSIIIFVPMLAPFLGQGVILLAGWRPIFAAYLAFALTLGLWVALRQPETLPQARRVPLRLLPLARNAGHILASGRVSALILATGLVFGTQLLFLSTAVDLFYDAYAISTGFPVYFAVIAAATGLASFLNGSLVSRFGMNRMARAGFYGLTGSGVLLAVASFSHDGSPPLAVFMGLCFGSFFAIGVLFGNLNAMAMQSLGRMAGLGASLIASGSSLVAALFAMGLGAAYDGQALYLAIGFAVSGAVGLALAEYALQADTTPIQPIK